MMNKEIVLVDYPRGFTAANLDPWAPLRREGEMKQMLAAFDCVYDSWKKLP